MKLFIPPLGTKLKLVEPWTFKLFLEYRNSSMLQHFKIRVLDVTSDNHQIVTLLPDTTLTIDRIYVRRGQGGFDSVTFAIPAQGKLKKRLRFWVKLEDANKIEALEIPL